MLLWISIMVALFGLVPDETTKNIWHPLPHGCSSPEWRTNLRREGALWSSMREIKLTNSDKVALVDDDGALLIGDRKWLLTHTGYPATGYYNPKAKQSGPVLMHRILMDCPAGMCVDHINRDRMDNRLCNLRIVSRTENNQHSKARSTKTTSRFKGVCLMRNTKYVLSKPWKVQISAHGKTHRIGYFALEIDAARAYDEAAIRLHGEFAVTNKHLGLL